MLINKYLNVLSLWGEPVFMQQGKVDQLNISQRGIPKTEVPQLRVTRLGPIGDNDDSLLSYGPRAAVSLFPRESYEELQKRPEVRVLGRTLQQNLEFKNKGGEPPKPGYFGEHITTSGLTYTVIAPGDKLWIGDGKFGVELVITGPKVGLEAVDVVFGRTWRDFIYGKADDCAIPGSINWGKGGFAARVTHEGLIRKGDNVTAWGSAEGLPGLQATLRGPVPNL